jgi:hypothetical protein
MQNSKKRSTDILIFLKNKNSSRFIGNFKKFDLKFLQIITKIYNKFF